MKDGTIYENHVDVSGLETDRVRIVYSTFVEPKYWFQGLMTVFVNREDIEFIRRDWNYVYASFKTVVRLVKEEMMIQKPPKWRCRELE